jgi:M6 family metalloprotease-like protein
VQVADVLYGFRPSVESSVDEYFLENSGGRFTIESEGVLGWFDAHKPWAHYWGPPDQEDLAEDRNGNGRLDPGEDLNSNGRLDGPDRILQEDEDTNQNGRLDYDLDGDGFINGHVEKWAEAIGLADASGFDFAAQDANRNGVLEPDELAILIVIPQDAPFGTFRGPLGQEFPTPQPLVVDGVRIHVIVEAYIGQPPHLGLVAHELSHILLNTPDMYFWFFYPYASGAYSLMDQHGRHPHLDPFHKLRLGWIAPTVVTRSGKFTIREMSRRTMRRSFYTIRRAATGNTTSSKIVGRAPSEHCQATIEICRTAVLPSGTSSKTRPYSGAFGSAEGGPERMEPRWSA